MIEFGQFQVRILTFEMFTKYQYLALSLSSLYQMLPIKVIIQYSRPAVREGFPSSDKVLLPLQRGHCVLFMSKENHSGSGGCSFTHRSASLYSLPNALALGYFF